MFNFSGHDAFSTGAYLTTVHPHIWRLRNGAAVSLIDQKPNTAGKLDFGNSDFGNSDYGNYDVGNNDYGNFDFGNSHFGTSVVEHKRGEHDDGVLELRSAIWVDCKLYWP